jgi:hypothetical protein
LSASDATQACHSAIAYSTSALMSPLCMLTAITAASFATSPGGDVKSTCQTLYNECSQTPLPPDAGATECAGAAQQLTGCTATIGQINQCLEDYVNAYKAAITAMKLSCDMASQISMDAGALSQPSVAPPTSCTTLPAGCAAFFANSSTAGG